MLIVFFLMMRRPPSSSLFPYTTLFQSLWWSRDDGLRAAGGDGRRVRLHGRAGVGSRRGRRHPNEPPGARHDPGLRRSEEHTSELQSRQYLVCRLLLEKKKQHRTNLIYL